MLTRLALVLQRARRCRAESWPDKTGAYQASLDRLLGNTESYPKVNSERLQSISNCVTALTARVTQLESKVEEIGRSHDDIITMKKDISSLETNLREVSSTCQDMGNIAEQVDALNNRLRRNILFSMASPEAHGETWSQTEQIVTDFIQTLLKIPAGEIERARHVGRKRNRYSCMIVIKFQNLKPEKEILNCAPLLQKP